MYPSLYYLFRDLFGIDFQPLKMIQMFGFFVAVAFLTGGYFWTKELKRKENDGLMKPSTRKVLKGGKASVSDLVSSALLGFLIGYKVIYIFFNFTAFAENTQGFLLSLKGNLWGGILFAAGSIYLKYRDSEKERAKYDKPTWEDEIVHPYQHVGNMTLIAAFAGLAGAKIFHNLENWNDFMADPVGAILSFDGLTMYGGLILASILLIWYGRKHGMPTPHLIDSAAAPLMIGYGVGRIGCHLSGDGDWGIDNVSPKPDWLSWIPDWLWAYDYPHNVVNYGEPIAGCMEEKYCTHLVPPVFPTPLYETIMCLFIFAILWSIRKKIKTPGILFSLYLIFNGVERFFIEKIRVNTLYDVNGFKFTQAELISTLLFFLGVAGVFYFRRLEKKKLTIDNS